MIAIVMPELDSAPTRLTRALGRWLIVLSYILCFIVAYADVVYPSVIIEPMNDTRVHITSVIMGALAFTGVVATLAHRWRLEWVPANVLTFLLLARAAPLWLDLGDHPTRLAAAALMTLGAGCISKRALDLFIFSEKTRLAARLRD